MIERGHAVGFGPDADFASILKCVVIPFDRLLSVKRDCEMISIEIDTNRVPLTGCDVHVSSLLLCAFAFDGVVNRHVVFEGIGASNVIVVRVLQSPDDAARLIFLAGNRLELHLDETVFNVGIVLKTNRERRLTRLFQHIRFSWSGIVFFDSPFRRAAASLRCCPARRRSAGLHVIKIHRLSRGYSCCDDIIADIVTLNFFTASFLSLILVLYGSGELTLSSPPIRNPPLIAFAKSFARPRPQ